MTGKSQRTKQRAERKIKKSETPTGEGAASHNKRVPSGYRRTKGGASQEGRLSSGADIAAAGNIDKTPPHIVDARGDQLVRSLGKDDGELRALEKEAILGKVERATKVQKGSVLVTEAQESALGGEGIWHMELSDGEANFTQPKTQWVKKKLGATVVVPGSRRNLFAAVPAARQGRLGTVLGLGDQPDYLVDTDGRRYRLRRDGELLVFDAWIQSQAGFRKVAMTHDSGASKNSVTKTTGEAWDCPGLDRIEFKGFEGSTAIGFGGNDLEVYMVPEQRDSDHLTMHDVLGTIAIEGMEVRQKMVV
jgi:hypothetical protein